MLLEPLDEVFGRRSNVRLLRALSPLERQVSGREAARLAGLSHRAIRSLDDLAALGLLDRQETAGQNLYAFNRSHALAGVIVDLFEAERRRTADLLRDLGAVAQSADVLYAGVYGSGARGEATAWSDMDVFILVGDERDADRADSRWLEAVAEMQERWGVRLSPIVLSLEQAREQARSGDPFLSEVVRDARRVHGPPLRELVDG